MGCQSEVEVGANLTFSICTHDPDTGILTDADSDPTYRVYEDETPAAILTGTMSKLDDGNTTGFYTKQIACSVANGFESGKTYTVYIEATVDGDKGGISYNFKATSWLTEIADAVHDEVVEGTLTDRQITRILLAALALKTAGGGTGTLTARDLADTKDRITLTVDANGNRLTVVLDGT